MEGSPEPDKLPAGLEYVDPDRPELGFRLIGKLSITDGMPVPEAPEEPESTSGVGWPD